MQQVLNEIADLPGVVGSCLFSRQNGNLYSGLPPAFTDDTVQTIARHTSRLVQMGGVVDMDIETIVLRYDSYAIITMPVDGETLLVTACEPQTNTSLITTTFSMLAGEFQNGLSELIRKPDIDADIEHTASQLAQVRSALAFVIGPMADMVFEDHLDRWKKNGPACKSRLPELLEMLVAELDDRSAATFKTKVKGFLSL